MSNRKTIRLFAVSATIAAAIATGAVALYSVPARAQVPTTPATNTPAVDNTPKRTLSDVLSRISQGAGVSVVADSTVASNQVPLPAAPTTPENFESQIADLVAALPKGTTWARLYLPAPANGRPYKGDDLADYALAQAKLFGRVGSAPDGTVEVMGKAVPASQADPVVTTLTLRPVYLVSNPSSRPAMAAAGTGNWTQMTDEQRQQYAQQQAQKLISMDPQSRQKAMQDMFSQQQAVMGAMFQSMSPDQRQQFFQSMRGAMGGGGGGGPRGGGRRGGQ